MRNFDVFGIAKEFHLTRYVAYKLTGIPVCKWQHARGRVGRSGHCKSDVFKLSWKLFKWPQQLDISPYCWWLACCTATQNVIDKNSNRCSICLSIVNSVIMSTFSMA